MASLLHQWCYLQVYKILRSLEHICVHPRMRYHTHAHTQHRHTHTLGLGDIRKENALWSRAFTISIYHNNYYKYFNFSLIFYVAYTIQEYPTVIFSIVL